jgi:hypothetical protein
MADLGHFPQIVPTEIPGLMVTGEVSIKPDGRLDGALSAAGRS